MSAGVLANLLQGYQAFVEACGLLEMVELRDAFIKKLSTFAFTIPEETVAAEPGTCAAFAMSPASFGMLLPWLCARASPSVD